MNIIQAAQKYIGKRETNGKNRSPVIDALNSWIGVPMASPYCATGVSRLLHECAQVNGDKREKPKSASSVAIRNWFIDKKSFSWDADALSGWKGAIGGWTNEDGKHGHVFVIEKRFTTWWIPWKRNRIVAIGTIEFNTDSEGSRDGDGIWRRKRKVPKDGSHNLWFCNTSSLPGGNYWN